jgi:hypothetical protein
MQSLLNTEQIERATTAIRRAVGGMEPGSRVSLDHVFAAFTEVRHVTELRLAAHSLTHPSVDAEATVNHALIEYRAALVEWDRHLPRLHGWLLAERARLSSRRVHAGSVQSWVATDQQTREPRSTR